MARRVRKNGSTGTVLMLAGGAAAAYLGYRWWKGRSTSSVLAPIVKAVTSAVAPGTSGEQAWSAYLASAMYRDSPPQMQLTHEQFLPGWAALTADQSALMMHAFTLSTEQVATLASDPVSAATYMAAAMVLMAPAMAAATQAADAQLPPDAKMDSSTIDMSTGTQVVVGVGPNGQPQVTSVNGIGSYYAG